LSIIPHARLHTHKTERKKKNKQEIRGGTTAPAMQTAVKSGFIPHTGSHHIQLLAGTAFFKSGSGSGSITPSIRWLSYQDWTCARFYYLINQFHTYKLKRRDPGYFVNFENGSQTKNEKKIKIKNLIDVFFYL
jgi:hypothetical protein